MAVAADPRRCRPAAWRKARGNSPSATIPTHRESPIIAKDRERFTFAPLIVAVIAHVTADHKVPEQEQILSAGCVAYNLLLGAQALGFGAQWLTGWAAYDREVATLLGLVDHERVVSFVHIGTAREAVPERVRPDTAALVSEWQPPH